MNGGFLAAKQRKLVCDYYSKLHGSNELGQAIAIYTIRKIENGDYTYREFLESALRRGHADGLSKRLKEELERSIAFSPATEPVLEVAAHSEITT